MKNISFLLLLYSEICFAQTYVGGSINTNTIWYASGNPYIVTDTITINENVTLTIKPGVIVKFEKGTPTRYNLVVDGTLRAIGTPDSIITFTSNEFIPSYNDWGAIIFNESANDFDFNSQTGCILQYCKLEYGGYYYVNFSLGLFIIVMNNSSAFVDHCSITKIGSDGIIYGSGCASEIKITNNQFISISSSVPPDKIRLLNDSLVEISCNLFYAVEGYPVYMEGNLNFHHNIIVNDDDAGFDIAPRNSFHHNTIVDNSSDFSMITLRGSMDHNTITRNGWMNDGDRIFLYIPDTSATSFYNNIYDQLPQFPGSSNYEVGTYLQRESYFTPDINFKNNWFNRNTVQEINQLIYDYNDDTVFYKINYQPFLLAPDMDAPVTPSTGVSKTYLGNNNVFVTWNANPDGDVAGYKIYWGNPTGYSFSHSIDVGNVTSYTLSNFFFNDTIAVTAYDFDADGTTDQCEGHESWFTYDYMFTGLEPIVSNQNFLRLYPNPANQFTVVEFSNELKPGGEIFILSTMGKIAKEIKLSKEPIQTIELAELPTGLYQLNFVFDSGITAYGKLVIAR